MSPIRLDLVFNPSRKLTSKDNAAFVDIIIVCKSSDQAAVVRQTDRQRTQLELENFILQGLQSRFSQKPV